MVQICNKCGECYIEGFNRIFHECIMGNSIIESQRELTIQQEERAERISFFTEILHTINLVLECKPLDKKLLEFRLDIIRRINEA
jgi:hypothetical protein